MDSSIWAAVRFAALSMGSRMCTALGRGATKERYILDGEVPAKLAERSSSQAMDSLWREASRASLRSMMMGRSLSLGGAEMRLARGEKAQRNRTFFPI
jgi:hypothetical protein